MDLVLCLELSCAYFGGLLFVAFSTKMLADCVIDMMA